MKVIIEVSYLLFLHDFSFGKMSQVRACSCFYDKTDYLNGSDIQYCTKVFI